jgi:NAD(P)-dependent dehydrogenase (short-subunit alcohol dehydrogenase family)
VKLIGRQDGNVYNEWEAYAQSKTALILFAHSLARFLGPKGVYSFSLHPGCKSPSPLVQLSKGNYQNLPKLNSYQE